MEMKPKPILAHYIGRRGVLAGGVMTIFYSGQLIALVNEHGQIIWRNRHYPLFLVEYLIECPSPDSYKWN